MMSSSSISGSISVSRHYGREEPLQVLLNPKTMSRVSPSFPVHPQMLPPVVQAFDLAVEEYKATHDDGFIITEQCQGSINNDHTSSSSQSLHSYSSSQCTESTILPNSSPSLSQLRQEEEEGEREEIGIEATHDDIVNDDIASKDKTESESETTPARADAGINVTPLRCSSGVVISTPLSAIGLSGFNNDNRLDYSAEEEEEEKEENEDQLDHDVTVEGREPAAGDSYFTEELYYTANDETTLISDINLNAVITTKSGSHGGDVASRDLLVSDDTDMISLSPINDDAMASTLISTRDGNHCREEGTDTAGGIITVTGSVSETVAKSYQNSRYCFEERNDFECLVSSQVTSKETAEELIMTDNLHIPELSIESVTASTYSNTEEAEIEGGAEDQFDIIQSSEPIVGTDPVNVSLVSERSSSTKQCSSCLLNEVTGSSKQRSSRRKRFNIAANFSAKGKENITHDTILSATRQDTVVMPGQVPPLETRSPPLSLQSPLPPPLTSSPSKISLSPPSLVQASSTSFTHSLPRKPPSPFSLLPNASAPKASPQPAAPTPPSQSPHVTPAPSLTPSPLKSRMHPSSPSLSPHPQKKIASSSKKSLPKSVDLDSQIKHQEKKIKDEITRLQKPLAPPAALIIIPNQQQQEKRVQTLHKSLEEKEDAELLTELDDEKSRLVKRVITANLKSLSTQFWNKQYRDCFESNADKYEPCLQVNELKAQEHSLSLQLDLFS